MSHGCGTLGGPSGFRTGNLAAASSNGKQHSLPKAPAHGATNKLAVTDHWADQAKGPTRLWGTTTKTKLGGEERLDGAPDHWEKGEFWNVDSNIKIWGEHEVKRNASSSAHDVHRHDQITRTLLEPLKGQEKIGVRQCVSGVVSPDCCFLEAWGFDLGSRDRQGRPAPLWKPPTSGEHFRSERSFERDLGRMTENFRSMRRSKTLPGNIMPVQTVRLKHEDVGGEAGEHAPPTQDEAGRSFGSRSCRFWDSYDHASRREAAKLACSVHSASASQHREFPHKDCELDPAAVYTLKYRKLGEDSLRKHLKASERSSTIRRSSSKGRKTIRLGASMGSGLGGTSTSISAAAE
mmetsp:Transcript_38188/g.122800  ORF Transcript_38188/g.122800 Transcript_38188/m.122800 type:complete len:349 (-) Transcript_38188:45-1091(-)|eukprot:CAMPEP_0203871612 /NCGR_PEP_ID=MMETSP0359-20131031/18825_1 /ASSEMBLY_ACC=CAM_ASM_000338 /TAXON_ID=268821 /ORGANISM="Scrippsiella Hangoei, Strain SHTV-5" /LENGTH=348 /DNA_ID=CAMNT_0050790287 /DNA_START=118 /DNA_END=1164 /DNA_ORIENTATION=+